MPAAKSVYIFGDFNNWDRKQYRLEKKDFGCWQLNLERGVIPHLSKVKLFIEGADGVWRDKISAWAKYAIQNEETKVLSLKL